MNIVFHIFELAISAAKRYLDEISLMKASNVNAVGAGCEWHLD